MALTINTNVASLVAQRNLTVATKALNTSLERLSTGYRINHAADNAAGLSISKLWVTQISSLDIVSDNAATGSDLLTTAEETYGLLTDHLQRIRDLTEQASNGTYGSSSLKAIQSEIAARFHEISRISANSEFNGIKLMSYDEGGDNSDVGMTADGLNIQVGLYANDNSRINISIDLFKNASVNGLFKGMASMPSQDGQTFSQLITAAGGSVTALNTDDGIQAFAAACSGLVYNSSDKSFVLQTGTDKGAREMIGFIDKAISDISSRVTKIGASQNRVTSAIDALSIQSQNLISSLSTLRDTDVAAESSNYLKAQILQQASSTLLSTANQLPSVALNLL